MSRKSVGPWLREQRLARGWGKAEMARRLHAAMSARSGAVPGVNSITRSLCGWEGGRYPQDRWRAVICQVLGIAFDDFPAPPGASTSRATAAELDPDDPRPWARVARTLLERIGSGELKPGAPLPRTAGIAREAGVSAPTARRAYAYLKDLGIIRYWPGTGYHVSGARPDGVPQRDGHGAGNGRVPDAKGGPECPAYQQSTPSPGSVTSTASLAGTSPADARRLL